jgi:RNA polymerase sigma factor (sigma-70 family)
MYGYARKRLDEEVIPQSMADPDDIVSTAFIAAWAKEPKPENPRAYMYEVMRNEVKQLVRRRCQSALAAARAIDRWHWDNPPALPDFSDLVADRLAVDDAVVELPHQQRAAAVVVDGLDYPRQEAAEMLGVRPGTVAQHVSRARKALRVSLIAMGFVVGWVLLVVLAGGEGHRVAQACVWGWRQDKDKDPLPAPLDYLLQRIENALGKVFGAALMVFSVFLNLQLLGGSGVDMSLAFDAWARDFELRFRSVR